MANAAPRERLQPSLLDRLTDDEPERKKESRESRVLSTRALRRSVIRDLTWLLNTDCFVARDALVGYPEVAKSVLNFGLPDLTGLTASGLNHNEVARKLRDVIATFEPRILPGTLHVEAMAPEGQRSPNCVAFQIEAELFAEPMSERLFLRTEVDLETGRFGMQEDTA